MQNIPLYQSIINALKAKIVSGELKAGDKLPTEAEISKQYNVSRITSKRALSELENANLIYRVQGKGSFVNSTIDFNHSSSKTNKEILLILPFADNPGLGDYTKGINEYLSTTDYTLNIQSKTIIGQRKLLDSARQSSNSGLIFYPENSMLDLDILYQYYLSGYPVVTIDKCIEGIPFHSVVSDNLTGGYLATKHLIDNNHKKIAFVASLKVENSSSLRERYFGYLKALYDHNLAFHSEDNFPDRYSAKDENNKNYKRDYYIHFIHSIIEQRITGVVAENDLIAIEIMQIAKELNLSIPNDFSIVGFDNIHLASFVEPQLTTISQNFSKMGYLAAQSLIHKIENPHNSLHKNEIVPIELIERHSVKKL